MNILLLAPHPFYTNRGTPIAVKFLCEGLAALGHQLDVLTYHLGEDINLPGVTIH
ncbi:MAG: glycosyltransferase, partial [Candidatus Electrothrix sp. AUS1_2]|nr:glycosyltransferase [Candidatus Electrothrix sp. AUS1_2]